MRTLISMLTEHFFATLRKFLIGPIILLTKGDKDRAEDLTAQRAKARGALAVISIEVALAFAVGIFSAWIYGLIFPG